MTDTAFQATFADFRLVKGRKCCQLIFEVQIEQADKALSVLGGIPNPEHSIWVGIARINPSKPRLTGKELWRASSECAMLCKDEIFQTYMGVKSEARAAEAVRNALGLIMSRAELDGNPGAAKAWSDLRLKYERWKQEHVT